MVIGLIIVGVFIIIYLIMKASSSARIDKVWEERVEAVTKNRKAFYAMLETQNFNTDVDFSYSNYYRTAKPIEIMAFKADLTKKKLAIGSFDDAGNSKIFDFSQITGFAIIDGERNTTMQSYTVGGAVGSSYGVGGVASTDTYQETTIGNVKFKVETNDLKNPVNIFVLNKYNVDVKSERYSALVNTIEQIKTFLSRVIDENKK